MDFTLMVILDKINYKKSFAIVMPKTSQHTLEYWDLNDYSKFYLQKPHIDIFFDAIRKEYDMIGLKHPHVRMLDEYGKEHYL